RSCLGGGFEMLAGSGPLGCNEYCDWADRCNFTMDDCESECENDENSVPRRICANAFFNEDSATPVCMELAQCQVLSCPDLCGRITCMGDSDVNLCVDACNE